MSDSCRQRGERVIQADDIVPPVPSYFGRKLFKESSRPAFVAGDAVRLGNAQGSPATVLSVGTESVLVRWECNGQMHEGAWEPDDLFSLYGR